MKKLLALFLMLALALVCAFSASAQETEQAQYIFWDKEPYVENETTKIIDHVVYKLVGFDENAYYEVYDWFDTYEASETVEEINIVPEIDGIKVTYIQPLGDIDFAKNNHNYSVKKITIPGTVTRIGSYCFAIFDGLEELTIPASVKTIEFDTDDDYYGSWTFYEMESLKKITFLGDLERLGGFANCQKLETVILKGSVKSLFSYAFENCVSLKNIDLPDTIERFGDYVFLNSGLTSIKIPKNLRWFYDEEGLVFKNCKDLKEVIFDSYHRQYLTLREGYFAGCTALEKVVFPESCESLTIGKSLFRDCTKLEKITFPTTCESLSIADDAFRGCTSLKTVTLPKESDFVTIGYRAFRGCKNLTAVNNTDNITKIYGGAFRDCTSLKSFTVSDKTTMIGKNAFYGCNSLKTVTVNSKTKAPRIYANAFAKTNSVLTFTAKNATAAKSWKTALTKSGLKTAKVGYMHYV